MTLFTSSFTRVPTPRREGKTPEAWGKEVAAMFAAIPREPTERHFQMAFAEQMRFLQSFAGERINEPGWRDQYDKLMTERDAHPSVRATAEMMAMHEASEQAWTLRFSLLMGEEDDEDAPAPADFGDLKRAMDCAAPNDAPMPSDVFEANRLALGSAWIDNPDKSQRECREDRERYEQAVVTEARTRYRAGFHADPFANPPRPRAEATPTPTPQQRG